MMIGYFGVFCLNCLLRFMLLSYILVLTGKLNKASRIFGLTIARGDFVPGSIDAHAPSDSSSSSSSSSSASSSSSSSGRPGQPRSLEAPIKRKVDFQALHRKAHGTIEYVWELLGSRFFRCIIFMISIVTEPIAREHSRMLIYLKGGAKKVRHAFGLLAGGIWRFTVVCVFRISLDLDLLGRMGMNTDMAPMSVEEIDDEEPCWCYRLIGTFSGTNAL